jgi:ABC-type hemin transport system substrate-binding protein
LPLAGHRTIKAEAVLALEPHALVVGCVRGAEQAALERLRQDPALRSLACVRKGRVLTVEAGVLTATSQHIVLAVERIAEQLDAWGRQ